MHHRSKYIKAINHINKPQNETQPIPWSQLMYPLKVLEAQVQEPLGFSENHAEDCRSGKAGLSCSLQPHPSSPSLTTSQLPPGPCGPCHSHMVIPGYIYSSGHITTGSALGHLSGLGMCIAVTPSIFMRKDSGRRPAQSLLMASELLDNREFWGGRMYRFQVGTFRPSLIWGLWGRAQAREDQGRNL